ncbi:uncharacterized protein K444DRAFT_634265 [Hyaloscypha bicolor E]|uniref:Uncharacterized protein n=1 Tax=Hyaloscypha bicolor E TaxID=1095630 RepID=A0A2J6SUU8_9HELO|nr:uncharacterized protein K444DRAFT_634265 [Hyaloscypha bicolor E]PMD54542.1 hypothetical protein K444DRAFT_634265 [Hyaloscypha bicolor E]
MWEDHGTIICGNRASSDTPDEIYSSPASDQLGQAPDATLVVTSPPLPSATAKPKDRTRSHHRVRKKSSRRKKGESPPTSPSTNRSSREPSTMLEESGSSMNRNQLSYAYQGQTYSGASSMSGLQQQSVAQLPTPPYQTMQSTIQGPQGFVPYRTGQTFDSQDAYQMTYSPQPKASNSVGCSSRIEDITRSPNEQQDNMDPNQPYIRSQYIMPNQDSVWRATR